MSRCKLPGWRRRQCSCCVLCFSAKGLISGGEKRANCVRSNYGKKPRMWIKALFNGSTGDDDWLRRHIYALWSLQIITQFDLFQLELLSLVQEVSTIWTPRNEHVRGEEQSKDETIETENDMTLYINHTCETTCGNTQVVEIRQRHAMHAWQSFSLSCLTSLNWWSRKSEKSRHKMDDEYCWGGGSGFSLCTEKARSGPACRNKSALCRISLASPSVGYLKR